MSWILQYLITSADIPSSPQALPFLSWLMASWSSSTSNGSVPIGSSAYTLIVVSLRLPLILISRFLNVGYQLSSLSCCVLPFTCPSFTFFLPDSLFIAFQDDIIFQLLLSTSISWICLSRKSWLAAICLVQFFLTFFQCLVSGVLWDGFRSEASWSFVLATSTLLSSLARSFSRFFIGTVAALRQFLCLLPQDSCT